MFGIDDAVIGSVVGSLGSAAIGGALDFMGQSSANEANAQAATNQMNFQREMDSTKYQRAVADLKAAGLNPMMAYGNMAAGSPSGSLGVGAQNTLSGTGRNIAEAGRGISDTVLKAAQVKNIDEQNKQIQATTAKEVATTETQKSQTNLNNQQALKVDQDILTNAALANLYKSQQANTSAQTARTSVETQGLRYDLSGKREEAGMYDRAGGSAVPYVKHVLPAVSSAVGGATIGSILGGKIKFGRKTK